MAEIGKSSRVIETRVPRLFQEPDQKIVVFESQQNRLPISIEAAAKQHLQLIEKFTKIVATVSSHAGGQPEDKFLAYAEWRFMQYFEMEAGITPPWDVAMLWYCYIHSVTKFHDYTSDRYRAQMDRAQFPLSKMTAIGWNDEEAQRRWERAASIRWSRSKHKSMPYQLWWKKPWIDKGPPSLHSHIAAAVKTTWMWLKRPYMLGRIDQPNGWDCGKDWEYPRKLASIGLRSWTAHRTGRRPFKCKRCHKRRRDRRSRRSRCSFEVFTSPWPKLGNLRWDLAKEMVFWQTILEIKDLKPQATDAGTNPNGIERACRSYLRFMMLLRDYTRSPPHNGLRFVPTLEISFIWRTHRQFQADYARWCLDNIGRFVDFDNSLTRERMEGAYEFTAKAWKRKYGVEYEGAGRSGGVLLPRTYSLGTAWLRTEWESSAIAKEEGISRTERTASKVETRFSMEVMAEAPVEPPDDDYSCSGGSGGGGDAGDCGSQDGGYSD